MEAVIFIGLQGPAENPVTCQKVVARRKRVRRDLELPMKDDYSALIRRLLQDSHQAP